MVSTRSLTDCTMTTVLLALMEIATSAKFSLLQILRNSMQLSTMPAGVSP